MILWKRQWVLFVLFLLMIQYSILLGQSSWLKIVYENEYFTEEDSYEAFTVGNDLIVFSGGVIITDQGIESYRRLQRFDANGEQTWTYNLEYDAIGVGMGTTITTDSCFYVVTNTSYDPLSDEYRPKIEKIDAAGNLVWERSLLGAQFTDFWVISNGAAVSDDGRGLVIVGRINADKTTMGRVELDPEGQLLRYHTFQAPMIPDYSFINRHTASVVSTGPGEVVVAYQNGQEFAQEESFLLRLDSTGQVQQTTHVGSRHVAKLDKLPLGDLILQAQNEASDFPCDTGPNPPCNSGPHLYRYPKVSLDSAWMIEQKTWITNNSGQDVARVDYGYAQDMIIKSNGDIISLVAYNNQIFLLECHTPEGERIWSRAVEIQNFYFAGATDERYRALDIIEAADGSLRIVGRVIFSHPELTPYLANYTNLMLMKLDSFGCTTPGCQLDSGQLTIYTDVMEQQPDEDEVQWQFFPNPAHHLLNIRYERNGLDRSAETMAFILSDGQGRMVRSGQLVPVQGLSVAQLPPGMYFLQLRLPQGKTKVIAFHKQ